jgi:hypothetical protein
MYTYMFFFLLLNYICVIVFAVKTRHNQGINVLFSSLNSYKRRIKYIIPVHFLQWKSKSGVYKNYKNKSTLSNRANTLAVNLSTHTCLALGIQLKLNSDFVSSIIKNTEIKLKNRPILLYKSNINSQIKSSISVQTFVKSCYFCVIKQIYKRSRLTLNSRKYIFFQL